MTSDSEFNTIRPYCDSEIEAAIERLCKSEEFLTLFTHLTKMDRATIQGALQGIRSRAEFQAKFFGPAIQSLINTTTDGITVSGMELVDKNTSYIFMSNHRDIKLDSCFVIERDITVREMLTSSALRSKYIREVIEENEDSVWIAEREGRTKNGDDKAQPSLLKMLKMSGPTQFGINFRELHIMPLAISYEWEPCDALKTSELYTKTVGEYIKTPEADMNSMLTGLSDYKGRVHFHIDQLTDQEFDELDQLPSNGDRIEALAGIIDSKIHQNFKLWPNNYIAYDLLHSVNKFKAFYTEEEKKRFIEVMTQKMDKLEGNISLLNNIYLEIYANPVKNQLKL